MKTKEEIRDYLEKNLSSAGDDTVMDNNDRLVWISDVTNVVESLVESTKEEYFKAGQQCWTEGYDDGTEISEFKYDNYKQYEEFTKKNTL